MTFPKVISKFCLRENRKRIIFNTMYKIDYKFDMWELKPIFPPRTPLINRFRSLSQECSQVKGGVRSVSCFVASISGIKPARFRLGNSRLHFCGIFGTFNYRVNPVFARVLNHFKGVNSAIFWACEMKIARVWKNLANKNVAQLRLNIS